MLKKFAKDTAIYSVGNAGLRLASFIVLPIYTYSLSSTEFGLLSVILITNQVIVIVISMGMRTCVIRYVKDYECKGKISLLIGTTTIVYAIGLVFVCLVIYSLCIKFFQHIYHLQNVYYYISLSICSALFEALSLHMMSYYRAKLKPAKFMISHVSTASILIIANCILLKGYNLGVYGALYALIFSYALLSIIVSIDIIRETGFSISFRLMFRLIKFGIPLVFSMVGHFVIGASTVYYLSYFSDLKVVAVYSLGYKLVNILNVMVILPFQLSVQPLIFTNIEDPSLKEKSSQILTYFILAETMMSFFIVISTHILIPYIAPKDYNLANIIVLLLVPGSLAHGIYCFSEAVLIANNRNYIIGMIMTIGTILSLCLSYYAIKYMNWTGAIISFNATRIIITIITLYYSLKIYPIPIEWKRIASIMLIFIINMMLLYRISNAEILLYILSIIFITICTYIWIYLGPFCNKQEKLIAKQIKDKSIILLKCKLSSKKI